MVNTDVPRPKAAERITNEDGTPTKEFMWWMSQIWLRTGGAGDAVGGALTATNNLSDVDSAPQSRANLGFSNPILNKDAPGTIGATTPNTARFTTVDTGQGANELHAMDQDVQTTDAVEFDQLLITDKFEVDADDNVVVGVAVLANAATDGFLYIPTVAGPPTGTPTTKTGTVAMVYDTTNDELYVYNAAWVKVTLA